MPIKWEVDELAVQLFGRALRTALELGQGGKYRLYLSRKDTVHGHGRCDFLKIDMPWAANGKSPAWETVDVPGAVPGFDTWKFPLAETEVSIERSYLGGALWVPAAFWQADHWEEVELAWPVQYVEKPLAWWRRILLRLAGA